MISLFEILSHLRKLVNSDNNLDTEFATVLDMPDQISTTFFESNQILLGIRLMQRLPGHYIRPSAMHFQSTSSSHNNRTVRRETAHPALDVAEFLHAHVGSKAALSQHIAYAVGGITLLSASEFESHTICENGGVSMRNVRERAGMNENRCALIL